MNRIQKTLAAFAVMLAVMISGCSRDNGTGEEPDSGKSTENRGEHDRDGSEHGEEGEESGTELALNETYDEVRNGARLILAYDAQSNSFNGTVENTTNDTLKGVRVEVHLSNGVELGPTIPSDLGPGEIMDVTIKARGGGFDGWTAHPEVGEGGGGEHGNGVGEGEHGGGGEGGHNEGGSN